MLKPLAGFLICVAAFVTVSGQYNVKGFGAKGDGVVLDTRSIQLAIDSANKNGGGLVFFPAGVYKIGTVILRSNVELQLSPGTVIVGSENLNDYTVIHQHYESRTKDLYAKFFMFFAENETNVSITGHGTIDGNGLKNFQQERPQNVRPFMMRFTNCKQVLIKNLRLIESANWTLHLLACSNVNIDGINVITTAEGNRDGIDIDACRNVTITNCVISTTDDAIVMKSTSDDVCSGVVITNCILSSNGSAIKTGTESNGGFKNITISNCVIKDVPIHAGIELMTVDGGAMRNILIQNISMENVATPFFIRIGARARPYKSAQYVQRLGNAADISLKNINVQKAKLPSSIIGLTNKKLTNVSVTGYSVRYVESQNGTAYNKVPSLEFDYPAANMFSNLPAFGIYCRDVSGLTLRDIKLYSSGPEEKRPAFVFDRIDNLQLYSAEAILGNIQSPIAYLRNISNAVVAFCRSANGSRSLFAVEGNIRSKIVFANNLLNNTQSLVSTVLPLPEMEDIDGKETWPVTASKDMNAYTPYKLKAGPINIPVAMRKGTSQLCLWVRNEKPGSSKVRISYDNIVQEFLVDWQQWGWAPISLVKQFSEDEQLNIRIEAAESGSSLCVDRFFVRPQDNGYTD
jgi:hypothetical protein